jgi:hypothetical protein
MKSSRLKTLLQNLALFFGSFLVVLMLLEAGLRMAGYGNVEIYEPDPVLYWKLKPNQNCFTKVDRKPVHINSHGTRGHEFSTEKPAHTIRILSLGDSKTFGWGLSEAESYSGLLESELKKRVGETNDVEVINAGVNAWSYPQMNAFFREVGLKYSPDFVVLADANLWTQFSDQNSPEFVKKFMWRVRLKNFLRRFAIYHYVVEVKLEKYYQQYRTKFIPIDPKTDALFKEQQQNDPEAFFRKSIEDLCRLGQQKGVQPVLLFIPMLSDLSSTNVSQVLKAKTRVSQELGVPLIDTTTELKPQGQSLYLEADPVHLNVEGNQIVARKLVEGILPMLQSRTNAPAGRSLTGG